MSKIYKAFSVQGNSHNYPDVWMYGRSNKRISIYRYSELTIYTYSTILGSII